MDRDHAIRIAVRGLSGLKREVVKELLCHHPEMIPPLMGVRLRTKRVQPPTREVEVVEMDEWQKPAA